MNKDEKERRGVLLRDLKAKERAEFEASLLASKADIRDLLEFLATDTPCDDTPRQTLCNTKSST